MHALRLRLPASAVEAASDALSDELEAVSVSIEDADAGTAAEEPVFDEPGSDAAAVWSRAFVEALFADEAAARAAALALAASEIGPVIEVIGVEAVDERDWVRLTQAQFGPSEIAAGFWIVPSWSEVPAGARLVIRLDPGLAFGTGTHPTTRMCLQWIAARGDAGGLAGRRVLDYGAGSGVLAIAAALHGAGAIDALDIDPAAVAATVANAAANGVALRAGLADATRGPYDLVVANILATPLKLLAPLLGALLAPGAELVLSGVLSRQADEMRAAYAPWLELQVAASDDGWILLTGRRPANAPMA